MIRHWTDMFKTPSSKSLLCCRKRGSTDISWAASNQCHQCQWSRCSIHIGSVDHMCECLWGLERSMTSDIGMDAPQIFGWEEGCSSLWSSFQSGVGRTGPGRVAMNHWNSLFHRWLESQEHICRPVSKFKMKATQQHEESANLSTAYLLALKMQDLRFSLNAKNKEITKVWVLSSRHWCCFHGHDVNVMLFCKPLPSHNLWLTPFGSSWLWLTIPPQIVAFLKVRKEKEELNWSEPWRWPHVEKPFFL